MNNKVLMFAMSLIIAGLYSGCVATTDQIKVAELPKSKTVVFNFSEIDEVSGEKIVFDLNDYLSDKHDETVPFFGLMNFNVDMYSSEVVKLSSYERFHTVRKGTVSDHAGLNVLPYKSRFDLSYENGEHNRGWFLDKVVFKINYVQQDDNSVVFTFPKNYTHQTKRNIIGIQMDTLDTLVKLEEDAKNIFIKLDKVILSMTVKYTLKDEVNTKYNDRAVYGNFERILGEFNWKESNKNYANEIKKKNTYAFKYGEETYPLSIEVYPYREGTKVVYSLHLHYDVSSNGTSSLTKEDITSIQEKIASIAND